MPLITTPAMLDDDYEPVEQAQMSEDAIALHRAMVEIDQLKADNKRLAAALRSAGRVLEPYIRPR